MNKVGTLYVVATPIGNRDDITLRALEILKSVDLIACEDTRHTGQLLAHYEIKKPLVSYFQHSKSSKIDFIVGELKSGKDIALVTDAGTPGISDPGEELISEIRKYNVVISTPRHLSGVEKSSSEKITRQARDDIVNIVPIPGPSALTALASVSGMIEKEFYFAGFLPKKKGRQTKFKQLSELDVPIVIYESANRLERTLVDIRGYLGSTTMVFIAREMTKMFEEYWGGNIEEVIADLKNHPQKGEIVLLVKCIK